MSAGEALRKSWHAAPAVLTLAVATFLVWMVAVVGQWSGELILHSAFFPERMMNLWGDGLLVPPWLTPVSSLFAHIGFLHLAVCLIALIVFGRAVEPAVGTIGLVILYVAGALAAAGVFFLLHPVGMYWVGAGGGVGAVLGAYAMLFGRNRAVAKGRAARWVYAMWLCVGWTLLSLLVIVAYADLWAIYFAPAYIASFAIGMPIGRLLLLFRYRKA